MILATRPTHHFGPPPFIRLSKARVWTFVDGEVAVLRRKRSEAAKLGWSNRRKRDYLVHVVFEALNRLGSRRRPVATLNDEMGRGK